MKNIKINKKSGRVLPPNLSKSVHERCYILLKFLQKQNSFAKQLQNKRVPINLHTISNIKIFLWFPLLTYDDVIAGDTKAWRDDAVLVQLVVDGIAHPLTRLPKINK
jgi:hypothetical protein